MKRGGGGGNYVVWSEIGRDLIRVPAQLAAHHTKDPNLENLKS